MNLIIIRIIERIEILLKNNTIINTQFNGKTSYKINEKETTFHVDLQSTNESNNNTDNTSDSIKHWDSETIALKEQTERQNIEIQALKAFFKEQVYILKKSGQVIQIIRVTFL